MSDRGITKGRDLYSMPGAIICPACNNVMRCEMDMTRPTLYLAAKCGQAHCRMHGIRYKVNLELVSAEEMKPGE